MQQRKKYVQFCSCCISTDKTVWGRFPRNVFGVITRSKQTLRRMLFPGRLAQPAREGPWLDGERTAVSQQGRWAAWGQVLVLGGLVKEEQVFRGIESGTKANVNAGEIQPVKTKVSSLNVKIFIYKKKKRTANLKENAFRVGMGRVVRWKRILQGHRWAVDKPNGSCRQS